jgi:transcription termination factor NusB
MKEVLDIINTVESVVDEVVDKLLHEVVEKVLKENNTYCKNILRWSMYEILYNGHCTFIVTRL